MTKILWTDNKPLFSILRGQHFQSENMNLIRVIDPDTDFPALPHAKMFNSILELKFYDNNEIPSDDIIDSIRTFIRHSIRFEMDLLVHCIAGKNRSGAICQYAEALGYKYLKADQNIPLSANSVLKSKLMENLNDYDRSA